MLFGHPVHKPWGMYDPAAELVDVVDEHGRTIGVVTRRELRERRLAHRSVYLLVFNARGEIFIHLRTATKDVSPSHWDLNIGGVLASGETYDEGARREALEELGVTLEPRPLFPFHFSDEHSTVHGMVYRAEHDGPFHLQAEEIVRGEFVTVEELERRLRTERFCPDGICVWRQFSMSEIKELSPSPRLLLGPGPCDAHPRVLRAMTTPLLGHLDPEFTRIMDETQELLRRVYQTNNPLTFAISGTGTAGMETCLVNLIEPGDRMLVCVNGFFGQRMSEIAQRAGANVTVLDRPWGEVFKLDQIRETINRVRPKVLGIVHAETSTGALQPMADLGRLCRDSDLLLLVDTVTSLGGVPVAVDEWGADAVYSCTQKGLAAPPGLSPVSFSQKALESIQRRKTKVQSWYLDVMLLQRYWSAERFYHHTAPISMTYALREALRLVVEEGLESRWARHQRNHLALKAGLQALGLNYVAAEDHILPVVNAVRIPPGVDDLAVRKRLLSEFGIEIGGGLGEFRGKAWRIGLMGYNSRAGVVLQFLAALEQCLAGAGHKVGPGAGVAAANGVYAGARS